jgi:hypothetical protein
MFELGARPHPPRDLYRAYLEQSDVFVGVYGASYGWVAPDEEVSGLEDEYNLAPASMPKLIYIKASSSATSVSRADRAHPIRRHRRLPLLRHGRRPRRAGRCGPRDPARRALRPVARAAAGLGIRRFAPIAHAGAVHAHHRARQGDRGHRRAARRASLPARDARRPGGIGKSRLAIAAAEAASALFPDGVVFVPLENVLEPELLLSAIGYALGIRETTGLQLEQRLSLALDKRRMLFVLDNFEQIVSAAPILVQLYSIAPDAAFLVTSRIVLRVRGERVYDVDPLATHDPASPDSLARHARARRRTLRRARVRANPLFELTDENLPRSSGSAGCSREYRSRSSSPRHARGC